MLQAILNRAQLSVDKLVTKYVTRLAVAVPFVVALGFGTAAAAVKLSQEFGSPIAYAVLAAAFAAVGLSASAIIAVSGSSATTTAVTEAQVRSDTRSADPGTVQAKSAIDPDLMMAALGTLGPAAIPTVVRLLARNLPLVLAIVMIAYILFSQRPETDASPETAT